MPEILTNYFYKSSPITLAVLGLLSLYFLLTVWIFIYRYFALGSWARKESESLETMQMGSASVSGVSILKQCLKRSLAMNAPVLDVCLYVAQRESTKGLTMLSLIATTSPFIGLFGTVVSILEAFAGMGTAKSASLGVVAPAISEALIATAAGIFVAVFAYSFHLLLKRKAYALMTLISIQKDLLVANAQASKR